MVGFISNLAPLLNYLRRRSPGPPFPPDHRQTGERGAIIEKLPNKESSFEESVESVEIFVIARNAL